MSSNRQPRRSLFGSREVKKDDLLEEQKNERKVAAQVALDDELARLSLSLADRNFPIVSTPKHEEKVPPIFAHISRVGSPANSTSSSRPYQHATRSAQTMTSNVGASKQQKTNSQNITSSRGVFGVTRNRNTIYFGFVAVGESQVVEHKLVNHSGEQLRLKYGLSTDTSVFQIVNAPPQLVQPNAEFVISLRYAPAGHGQDTNVLLIERINRDYQKFSFKLLGYGEKAVVCLDPKQFSSGVAQETPSGVIVLTPDFFPPIPSPIIQQKCFFDLVNTGERSAFVLILAVDKNGQQLPTRYVSIQPYKFVISGKTNNSPGTNMRISVRVNSACNDNARRESGFSVTSTAPLVDECGFRLILTWGEELQRMRFRSWLQMRKDPYIIQGQNYGDTFIGEVSPSNNTILPLIDRPLELEGDEFQNALRVIKINVIDNRAIRLYLPAYIRATVNERKE